MEEQVEAVLKDLKKSLDSIKALCAWKNLKKTERRRGEPPSFQIYDPIEQEIQLEVGFFHKTAFDIKDVLPKLPSSEQAKVRKRLDSLESKLQAIL